MSKRIVVSTIDDPSILAEVLQFPTSKKVVKNRFLKAALTERISSYVRNEPEKCGIPTERLVNLYTKWGHGGFGLIFTGNIVVDYKHLESAGNAIIDQRIESTERRNAFRKIANAMKSDGSVAIAQLSNAGRQTPITINEHPFSASDVQLKVMRRGAGFGVPIPLSEEQIHTEVIDRFVYAAKFCKDVGFDGIELHGAHGYLLAQFMSPTTNKRTDRYGGSVENRVRIVLEIYAAIRKEIPAETGFIIGIKMNSVEFQDQGLQTDDAVFMCQEFEKCGFDFIELSGGTIEKLAFQHMKDSTRAREAFFLEFAKRIKPALTKTVVYLTGGFRTVRGMTKAIQDGATDGIGLGRPITAEPDLPKKILSGQIQSALVNPFDDDFAISNTSSNSQMAQAGSTTIEEVKGNLCHGIMDLSDENIANQYKEAVAKYHEQIFKLAQAGNPIAGVFEYGLENAVNSGS